MAKVGRIAGAILAETDGQFFLVGNLKEPCKFDAYGFEPPARIDATRHPYVKLVPTREIALASPFLTLGIEGEMVARVLAERLLIQRNGSVSERLWRLVTNPEGDEEAQPPNSIECQWLADMPDAIWDIVRDSVLRCL